MYFFILEYFSFNVQLYIFEFSACDLIAFLIFAVLFLWNIEQYSSFRFECVIIFYFLLIVLTIK